MTERLAIPAGLTTADAWLATAAQVLAWCGRVGVPLKDAVVLVPAVHHIALMQHAFGQVGATIPTVDTAWTLSQAVAPASPTEPGQVSGATATDRLVAARMLQRSHGRGGGRAARHAAAAVTSTAQAMVRGAAAIDPALRPARYASWRQRLGAPAGQPSPGMHEGLLARVALEWAALAPAPLSDALFALSPAAWVVVETSSAAEGDPGSVERSLLAAHDAMRPTLLVDVTVGEAAPPIDTRCTAVVCNGFEEEAQRAAAAVIAHGRAGRWPVALIAQDRLVVRRIRALLGRQRLPIRDETGWTLSTTRAAAMLRSLLRAALPGAVGDDWLDWLKACPGARPRDVDAIEARWRRSRTPAPVLIDAATLGAGAPLWREAQAAVATLVVGRPKTLPAWRRALTEASQALGLQSALERDDAGAQVLAVLQIWPHFGDADSDGSSAGGPWSNDIDGIGAIAYADFTDWVDTALEEAVYRPPSATDGADVVVITPLARAVLRPFAAIVFPGADGHGLGGAGQPATLLADADHVAMGLPGRDTARRGVAEALAQLLRQPRVDFLCRRQDAGDPWPPSTLLQQLQRLHPNAWTLPDDARVTRVTLPAPVPHPLPRAPHLLPATLSASACEALRACPYRHFALHLLRLHETDELDTEPAKRDYGTWLHAVLHAFHVGRDATPPIEADRAALDAAAHHAQAGLALDDAAFLPFIASFRRFAPRYLAWLHAHEAEGARWHDGELALTAQPPAWGGTAMHGRIDRIDTVAGQLRRRLLIDYKTGSRTRLADALRSKEDVQLPFYAALVAAQGTADGQVDAAVALADVTASYLLLDDAKGVEALPHRDLAESAEALVAGIGVDLQRLRAGAPMPALGVGDACTHCAARGLCRRDHWAPPSLSGRAP